MKSQISMEFIIIISLVILVFIGFSSVMYNQFSELDEERDYSVMYDLANTIKQEVIIASQVSNNYLRRFEIPYRVNGKDYRIQLEKDVLTIINENNNSITVIIPVEAKGGFIDRIEKGALKHCITKNEFDGIRISKNQASIEGALKVSAGQEFYAYLRLNCLDNVHTTGFTLNLNNLDYVGYDLLYQYDEYGNLQTQFERQIPFFEKKPDEENVLVAWSSDEGKLSFSIPQKSGQASSGSGNIIKLRLKAGNAGTAKIDFVKDKLFLIDVTATKLTKEALPASYVPLNIEVVGEGAWTGCECSDLSCNSDYNGEVCDGCYYVTAPAELCNDEIDNDCDGLADYADLDCESSTFQFSDTFIDESTIASLENLIIIDGKISIAEDFDSGLLTSTNLLSGQTVTIQSFTYEVSISGAATLSIIFSKDNINWYDSSGNNNWEPLSDGRHTIDLSFLKWTTSSFYYKIKFTAGSTPVLHEITLNYAASPAECECSENICEQGNTGRKCDGCNYVKAPGEICKDDIDNDCDGFINEECPIGTISVNTTATPNPNYPDSGNELNDGKIATNNPDDPSWVGYDGNVEITLDLGTVTTIDSASSHFLSSTQDNIYLPESVDIYTSIDGINYVKVGSFTIPQDSSTPTNIWLETTFPQISVRYVKFSITSPLGSLTLLDEVTTSTAGCDCSGSICQPGTAGKVCDGCNYITASAEQCKDNIDNDCDSLIDYNDLDCKIDNGTCSSDIECSSGNCIGPNFHCAPADKECYFNSPAQALDIGQPNNSQNICWEKCSYENCTTDNYPQCGAGKSYCTMGPTNKHQCLNAGTSDLWKEPCSGTTPSCDSTTGNCKCTSTSCPSGYYCDNGVCQLSSCTPDAYASECYSDTARKKCNSLGSGWIAEQCTINDKCENNICVDDCTDISNAFCTNSAGLSMENSYTLYTNFCPGDSACIKCNDGFVKEGGIGSEYCTCMSSEINYCNDGIDNDCDSESDYDSQDGRHGDNDCAVSITSVSVSNSNPTAGTSITVSCTSTIPNVNSITSKIDEVGLCSFNNWNGNNAVFTCNVGTTGTKTVRCYIDTSKSYQTGADKTTTITVKSACICTSGACCDGCNYKTTNSQPTGISDTYSISGTNSATTTSYCHKRDYYCTGSSSSETYTDQLVNTASTCAYISNCYSTVSGSVYYYPSSTQGPTADTYYISGTNSATTTSYCYKRDYHCTGNSASETYDNLLQQTAGTCKYISGCSGYTSGTVTNYASGTSCGTNMECDGSGNCIQSKKPNGQSCTSASECISGYCADGYCCNTACTESCKICNSPGYVGTCYYVSSGQDPNNDCGDYAVCDGSGTCFGSIATTCQHLASSAFCVGDGVSLGITTTTGCLSYCQSRRAACCTWAYSSNECRAYSRPSVIVSGALIHSDNRASNCMPSGFSSPCVLNSNKHCEGISINSYSSIAGNDASCKIYCSYLGASCCESGYTQGAYFTIYYCHAYSGSYASGTRGGVTASSAGTC